MCGGGQTESRTVVQKVASDIPEYVKEGGKELYEGGKELSKRDFPLYGDQPRLAGFSPETSQAFDMIKNASGSWQQPFNKAMTSIDRATAPVGEADIAKYMDPYTDQVMGNVTEDLNRQYERDRIQRAGNMSARGSYLNEDRRGVIEGQAQEARDRNLATISAQMRSQAYQQALQQGNTERAQALQGGAAYAGMAPMVQQLGYGDAGKMMDVGSAKQAAEQQELSLAYDDFMKQFYYPQEQTNWLTSILQGVPYAQTQTTSGQQYVPMPNSFAQNLGGIGALMGGYGAMGGTF